jgi:hypothetical protein
MPEGGGRSPAGEYFTAKSLSECCSQKMSSKKCVALRQTPSATVASKAAGISRYTAYDHREGDPHFAKLWEDSLNQSLDILEHEVYQRRAQG